MFKKGMLVFNSDIFLIFPYPIKCSICKCLLMTNIVVFVQTWVLFLICFHWILFNWVLYFFQKFRNDNRNFLCVLSLPTCNGVLHSLGSVRIPINYLIASISVHSSHILSWFNTGPTVATTVHCTLLFVLHVLKCFIKPYRYQVYKCTRSR